MKLKILTAGQASRLPAHELGRQNERWGTEDAAINSALIAAGRELETSSECAGKTDPLSLRCTRCATMRRILFEECGRRKAWSGTLKPIPAGMR